MAGLDPAIHEPFARSVDARLKAGHDDQMGDSD